MTRVRIPQGLPTWQELNRRSAGESALVLAEQDALDTFTLAAYGGADKESFIGTTIGAAYQTVQFDRLTIDPPRHFTFDLGANTFRAEQPGVYAMSFAASLLHNTNNGTVRSIDFRFYNVTDGVALQPFARAVTARAVEATTLSIVLVREFSLGKEWRIEYGNSVAATYTSVQWQQTIISLWSVGTYRGQF